MSRFAYLFIWALFLTVVNRNHFVLSSPSHDKPSLTSILSIHGGSNTTSPKSRTKSSVTFLYELHEHEIYDPHLSTWTSRRFTQSPITGGGGRDSTSLDPQSTTPPRNYVWDGEWKIDMTGEMRDGFGWEYYVGKFDGLGRRRRRWVRNLRRVGASDQVVREGLAKNNVTKTEFGIEEKKISPTLFKSIVDQYSFKGFGWSFTKSLLWKRSFGATFRIPLSSNFEFLDRYAAIPFASWTTYFGYPCVIATFLNASVPLEVLEWIIGGFLWKIKWALAVMSAMVRSIVDAAVWIAMTPWRTWLIFHQIMSNVARKHVSKSGMAQSLIDSIDAESDGKDGDDKSTQSLKNESKNDKIDGLIEMSTASTSKDVTPVSTSAVVSSPRGGASSAPRKRRFKTILGHEVPTFHRRTNIEYSSIISQRIGICISYRVSKERGYEYRWNFFCSFLPTQQCWEYIDKIASQKINALKLFAPKNTKSVDGYESVSKPSAIKNFLYEHSATLGLSSGYPLPVDPFFSLSLLFSTSGFYYGWLLKYIASVLCLQRPKHTSEVHAIDSSAEINDTKQIASAKSSPTLTKKTRDEDSDASYEESNTQAT